METANQTTDQSTFVTDRDLFLQDSYGFRTWRCAVGLIGFGFLAAGGVCFLLVNVMAGPRDPLEWVALAGFAVVIAFFVAIASHLGYGAMTGRRVSVTVDAIGIAVGRKRWAWERIERVFGIRDGGGVRLVFNARRGGVDRAVWTDRPIDRERYTVLRDRLVGFLPARHPDVDCSGL